MVLKSPLLLQPNSETFGGTINREMTYNAKRIRQEFPLLASGDFVYLDSAATTQKPQAVLDALHRFYCEDNSNVHRGMHMLAERATIAYEEARSVVAKFIGATPQEIIFTKNCTEAINLVARSWGKANLRRGDTVVLSILEHHSNIVPWLMLKEEIGIAVEWMDIDNNGVLRIEQLDALLAKGNVKLVSVTGLSNVLGTKTPLKTIVQTSHIAGAKVLVDAAQLVAHAPIDVADIDCDFLAFSGHKLYGPTGIGVLFGKRDLLERMPPFLGGGMMIGEVKKDHFTAADLPQKFEAGTPPIAEAVGLAAAITWLSQYSWKDMEAHEDSVLRYAVSKLQSIDSLSILPNPCPNPNPIGSLSFIIAGIHPHDLTDIIGKKGVCLRAGHHCTQPLHERLGIKASTRLSVGIYTTNEDIDRAATAIKDALNMLRP